MVQRQRRGCKESCKWHRDDVRARAVDLFAGIEVVLASAAVGTGDVEGKVAWGGWVGGGLGWGVG